MGLSAFDKEDNALMAEINTTPLVDVMLVLLVIFLVTAPMLTQAIKLELPGESASEIKDREPLTVSIDQSGQFYIDKTPLDDVELVSRLQEAGRQNKETVIHIRADTSTAYGRISTVMAAAQKAGLHNVGFVMQPY